MYMLKPWIMPKHMPVGKDKDKTIEYLNKAYDERHERMLDLKVEKRWDFVRDDPRFKELVKKVGIPE